MSQYLVLLDQSNLDDSALSEFDRLNTDESTFHLVVPTRSLSDDEQAFLDIETGPTGANETTEVTAAKWRLRDAVGRLHDRGLDVTGAVGPQDPLDAIGSALDHGDHDKVVVVTDPAGMSGWVGLDLASRIDRRVTEPVITVLT